MARSAMIGSRRVPARRGDSRRNSEAGSRPRMCSPCEATRPQPIHDEGNSSHDSPSVVSAPWRVSRKRSQNGEHVRIELRVSRIVRWRANSLIVRKILSPTKGSARDACKSPSHGLRRLLRGAQQLDVWTSTRSVHAQEFPVRIEQNRAETHAHRRTLPGRNSVGRVAGRLKDR